MKPNLLGSLVSLAKGRKHEISHSGTRYIQIDDLRHSNNIKHTAASLGTEVNEDDLVIVWDGAYSGLVSYGLKGFIGSTLVRLRPVDKSLTHTPYLGHFLKAKFHYLQSQTTGATIPHVGKHSLLSLEVPLPPLPEQKRIAAILDKADEIRRKREKAIELTDSFVRSVFLEMFGDPSRNSRGWAVQTLEGVCGKGQYGLSIVSSDDSTGTRFIRITDIDSSGRLIEAKAVFVPSNMENLADYLLDRGDILIARSGATVGKSYLHDLDQGEFAFAGYMVRFKPKHQIVLSEYIAHFLNSEFYWRQVKQKQTVVAQPNLNAKLMGEIKLLLPPLDLQRRFAAICKTVRSAQLRMMEASCDSQRLVSSLTHNLFLQQRSKSPTEAFSRQEAHAL